MIIDIILDRREGAISYDYATAAGLSDIAAAVDGGTEDDVKAALMDYVINGGCNPDIHHHNFFDLCLFIKRVRWTDDAPALEDLDMMNVWEGVNYDVADIDTFLETEAGRPVAYSTVIYPSGEVETIKEIERMGYAARKAFNIPDDEE